MEVDINDKKQEDAYEDSFCGSFINTEDPVIDDTNGTNNYDTMFELANKLTKEKKYLEATN